MKADNRLVLEDYEDEQYYKLRRLSDNIRFNGAEHLGAPIPNAKVGYINQCNLANGMRLKSLEATICGDDCIKVDYVSQEDFSKDDANDFEYELQSAVEELAERFGVTIPFKVIYTCVSRDGSEYGYASGELHFNGRK